LVPGIRVSEKNIAAVRSDGEYVLYWMIASRRTRWNFALDRAVEWASELGKPILVLEALRCDYPWASDRIHRFVIDGMRSNEAALDGSGVGYYPYAEPTKGDGKGLLAALAKHAAVVVTDEFPCFFLPRMVERAAAELDVKLEAVDSNGLLPLAAADKAFHRAFDFRRFLQRELPNHLGDFPRQSVLRGGAPVSFRGVPKTIQQRWPRASAKLLDGRGSLEDLPIDHGLAPVAESGGYEAAQRALRRFLGGRLDRYGTERNDPDADAASEFSGYLHFGHISSHQILDAIARREDWTPWKLSDSTAGKRRGWWNLEESVESFLDELVTWREIGYNFCFHRPDYAELGSLPDWARKTLDEHRSDERPEVYGLADFEEAATHDQIWNAAQNELRARGRIHNYLRMLWGKKILHWSRTPEEALDIMIELNNKYAIDGRNPNSYSGIFWVLGRFDRAWGPEREVFGKVRYMSSKNTRRKLRLDPYLKRWTSSRLSPL
jgi:deoxyribodipyrimidine photo-lyase